MHQGNSSVIRLSAVLDVMTRHVAMRRDPMEAKMSPILPNEAICRSYLDVRAM